MSHGASPPGLIGYPLLDALRDRRSRRFGTGMSMDGGPLAYRSKTPGKRLSEDEEALLAFAACGITGDALGELDYRPGEGGTIMAGFAGRTVPSGDAIHSVSVFVINQDATYWLRRPQDFPSGTLPELVELARSGSFTELYRRSRVKLCDRRTEAPLDPLVNLAVNRWSLYDPAATYFLPVNELTLLYINGLLDILTPEAAAFVVDERARFRPAGLRRFARSRGGHLDDDPKNERVITIQQLEGLVVEFTTIEQGMILQNLGLMTQAMGLGGFPHWAAHPFGWLEALGFRTEAMPASRFLGMNRVLALLARITGRDAPVRLPLGLEHEGRPLLVPYCPPYRPSMEHAVRAVVDLKFGPGGAFASDGIAGAWRNPSGIAETAQPPGPETIEATIAYCEYVYDRYGRFPVYPPPFRTVLGFQAGHVDAGFYDEYYRADALSETQRRHDERWHAGR